MISTETKPSPTTAREGQVDIREDEDQSVKLSEIVELLLAAGYFRARIKGLSPFDKIVGGMTWCIETCNFDVDVDLLFHENLTIGQKIALTERIVSVVRSMGCPPRLEPHQIQGLDAIHIFPVIQWLVKKALETREEFGDETRQFAVHEFMRHHTNPQQQQRREVLGHVSTTLASVQSNYGPKRRLRRRPGTAPPDTPAARVHTTVLEYGLSSHRTPSLRVKGEGSDEADGGSGNEMEEVEKQLMKTLHIAEISEGRLSAQQVGSIVSSRAQEIAATSQHYSDLQQTIVDEVLGDSATSQLRALASLEQQRMALQGRLTEVEAEQAKARERVKEATGRLQDIKKERQKVEEEMRSLGVKDNASRSALEELSRLVELNEAARKKETEFKDACRKEAERMKAEISTLQTRITETGEGQEEGERRLAAEKERWGRARRQLAGRTRRVEAMRRLLDDRPGRAELSQYQRRFIELSNQVAATHRETQQFYNMYNTLADTKVYMEKEQSLLNSILDNMAVALGNSSSMDEYLHQLETIVEGIRQNKMKLERRRAEERARKTNLSEELARLQDLNRQYAKTVHQLGQEIARSEALHLKLTAGRG
ncbi:coiled-coil domain-containing protein 93-like isoform X2 [Portunus trituberculatus]|uniref:coiled-coil domain-containing protein 93-like isoform X2 n=1 Tax=Portunus trituberculatus TaxID=210409 RepID=UPI001E1CB663|nr:coiled-coil domain-containing protein 93-like isoform X2 [Portunus trituberculatus]